MPRKKSNTSTAARKINKSAWIREQPRSLSAREVVEKASKAGIKLTDAQVYTARSSAKKAKGKPGPKPGFKSARKAAGANGTSDELLFKRLVLSIGLPKSEAYLNDLKRSVGL
jgi:hypothetical protein